MKALDISTQVFGILQINSRDNNVSGKRRKLDTRSSEKDYQSNVGFSHLKRVVKTFSDNF